MKGDFSKYTFDQKKHFHDVLMQQGRVLLDSDWNEQGAMAAYRVETGANDIIGSSGAPKHDSGFQIIPVNDSSSRPLLKDLKISKGKFYVDGILCENEEDVLFADQPDFCSESLPSNAGTYIFYLDVWQRHLTAVENYVIREVALGGPDTTTRTKTIWQVKHAKIDPTDTCEKPWSEIVSVSTGMMKAKSKEVSGKEDPCGLKATGGFSRLENQLYRVEIHSPGSCSEATFKWSRDNGSVVMKWEGQDSADPNKLIVNSENKDEKLGFKAGDWIEIISDKTDLLNNAGILAELSKVDGNVFTVKAGSEIFPSEFSQIDFKEWEGNNPRIRRWDSNGALDLNTIDNEWIDLEDGVQVTFDSGNSGQGHFNTGDYWLIPARTDKEDVEWPYSDAQPPLGITHHYAKLAIGILENGIWEEEKMKDCRPVFPPLTELLSFFYLSGDGQEARPNHLLPNKLMVGVANGKWPVSGLKVTFEVLKGDGSITPTNNGDTNFDGIAECSWELGTEGEQQVKAYLKDANGKIIHLPVTFNAKLIPPEMFYVSGDGQEAIPGETLQYPLKVGVAYEDIPVEGAKIKFRILDSAHGSLTPVNNGETGLNGIAECKWTLGTVISEEQKVEATLIDKSNNPIHLPIIFTTSFSLASKIKYDGSGCNNWEGLSHDTVAEAINSLCKRSNGQGCSVTVGDRGQFKTLQDAFDGLKKEMDICICLLPQEKEHKLEELEIEKKGTVKIIGCGTHIKMEGSLLSLTAEKIILNGFTLIVTEKEEAQIILTVTDLIVDHCTFEYNYERSKIPFILVSPLRVNKKKVSMIRWNNNRINASMSLALKPGVGGWIENNQIEGDIFLLYEDNPFPLSWDSDIRGGIEVRLEKIGLRTMDSLLHLHANHFNSVHTNPGIKLLDILKDSFEDTILSYRNLIVSENIINGTDSSFISDTLSLVNNQFNSKDDQTTVYLLGHTGVVMGNTLKKSAGGIDTLFDAERKILTPNIGPVS